MNLHALWAELHRREFTTGAELPGVKFADEANPWYTRVLLGCMGWVGGFLVLGFFGTLLSGLFNSTPALTVLSVAMFVLSYSIYHRFPKNDFASQFALTSSVCAQALAVAAYGKFVNPMGSGGDTELALFAAVMQCVLVWLMPSFLHRLISTLFAMLALYFAARHGAYSVAVNLVFAFAFVGLAFAESRLVAAGQRVRVDPVLNGLAVGLLLSGTGYVRLFGGEIWLPFAPLSSLAFAAALLGWITLATRQRTMAERAGALIAGVAFAAAAWRAPGLIASGLVLLVTFSLGRRVLVNFATLALLAFLSTYYYQMNISLALKSAVLAATGAVLLICWWVHRQYFSSEAA